MSGTRYCPKCFHATGEVIYYAHQQGECAVCHSTQLESWPELDDQLPSTEQVLADPAASSWIKQALQSALSRDPVDAANDAEVLAGLLDTRCQKIFGES
jgi:3'-phosphoadenosine 5'-phosphosulfate (PAPS) 3'-phosphatase